MHTRDCRKGGWLWSRRTVLFAIGFLITYLPSWLARAKNQRLQGEELQPEPPETLSVSPLRNFQPSENSPLVPFVDDALPHQWWYTTPAQEDLGSKVVAQMQRDKTDRSLEQVLKPLSSDKLLQDSWPDFTDAIDLKALGNEQPEVRSVFYTIVSFNQPRLLRVCHGMAGLNVTAQMWVAGVPVQHGELLRVRAGLYPIVVEAYHGKRTKWLPWQLARLATRLTEVTEEEVEEVYQWQLARWQANRQMAQANEEELLATVKFEPNTIRGTAGFFRVGQSIHGKWWLIDPNGKAFCHRGCTGLNAGGMGGRRANLPSVPEKTAQEWIAYLREWGFNALGAWTTPEFFNKGMPFTRNYRNVLRRTVAAGSFPRCLGYPVEQQR